MKSICFIMSIKIFTLNGSCFLIGGFEKMNDKSFIEELRQKCEEYGVT